MFTLSASPYGETIYREFETRAEADEFGAWIASLEGEYLTSWGYAPVNNEFTVWETEDEPNTEEFDRQAYAETRGWTLEQLAEFEETYGVKAEELEAKRIAEDAAFQQMGYFDRIPETYQER